MISVIGDSYVEALQVQNEDTFHAKLDQRLENFDAYPFGVSGCNCLNIWHSQISRRLNSFPRYSSS